MNRSAREGKIVQRFERSDGLDTALYKKLNYLFLQDDNDISTYYCYNKIKLAALTKRWQGTLEAAIVSLNVNVIDYSVRWNNASDTPSAGHTFLSLRPHIIIIRAQPCPFLCIVQSLSSFVFFSYTVQHQQADDFGRLGAHAEGVICG